MWSENQKRKRGIGIEISDTHVETTLPPRVPLLVGGLWRPGREGAILSSGSTAALFPSVGELGSTVGRSCGAEDDRADGCF